MKYTVPGICTDGTLPEIDEDETTASGKYGEIANTQAMEVKNIVTKIVTKWSTATEKKSSANWALNSNTPTNKACRHTHVRQAHTHMYTHIVGGLITRRSKHICFLYAT